MKKLSYKSTIGACYMGYVVLALVVNLTPILFIPLQELYGISFSQLGLLISINFVVQVATDLAFGKPVDLFGPRPFVVLAQILAVLGLLLFAFAADLFSNVYAGLVLGTILFSIGGGLLELLINPIANAIPGEQKTAAMSILHSFYSWGQIAVIIITTLLVHFWGAQGWKWIALIWGIVPLANIFLFAKVPLAPFVKEGKTQTPLRKIIKSKYFVLVIVCIVVGAASEHVMGEWSSSFMERAAGLPKMLGDVAGVCGFAFMMGISRIVYAKTGGKRLSDVMLGGAILAALSYLLIGFTNNTVLTLLACALCGLAVSIMWPGCIVLASDRFPHAGASMYSVLAASGDTGAAFAPWLAGIVTDTVAKTSGDVVGLKTAMLVTCIFPIIMIFVMIAIKQERKKSGLIAKEK